MQERRDRNRCSQLVSNVITNNSNYQADFRRFSQKWHLKYAALDEEIRSAESCGQITAREAADMRKLMVRP